MARVAGVGEQAGDAALMKEIGTLFEEKFARAKIAIAGDDKIEEDRGILRLRFDDEHADRHHIAQDEERELVAFGFEQIGGDEFQNLAAVEIEEVFEVGTFGADLHEREVILLPPHLREVVYIDAQNQAVEKDDRYRADQQAVYDEEDRADHVDGAQTHQ